MAPADIDRAYSPFPDVMVVRDRKAGVPHIFGTTRRATMQAQGYTAAEDRLFLMDALRHVGRARLSEFLGPSPENQAMDRNQLAVAPYTEGDLTAQVAAIAATGPEGAMVAADLKAYAEGVNAYITQALIDPLKLPAEYPALQQVPRSWSPQDTVAVAAYVGGRLGKGGGNELSNLCDVFDDLHMADDPESPATSSQPAPYPTGLGPVDPASQPCRRGGRGSGTGRGSFPGQHSHGTSTRPRAGSRHGTTARPPAGGRPTTRSTSAPSTAASCWTAASRRPLWQSLSAAAADLQGEFGSPTVGDWRRTVADDQIEYSALGLVSVPPAPWVNRPTFQQVVQVGSQ